MCFYLFWGRWLWGVVMREREFAYSPRRNEATSEQTLKEEQNQNHQTQKLTAWSSRNP